MAIVTTTTFVLSTNALTERVNIQSLPNCPQSVEMANVKREKIVKIVQTIVEPNSLVVNVDGFVVMVDWIIPLSIIPSIESMPLRVW